MGRAKRDQKSFYFVQFTFFIPSTWFGNPLDFAVIGVALNLLYNSRIQIPLPQYTSEIIMRSRSGDGHVWRAFPFFIDGLGTQSKHTFFYEKLMKVAFIHKCSLWWSIASSVAFSKNNIVHFCSIQLQLITSSDPIHTASMYSQMQLAIVNRFEC